MLDTNRSALRIAFIGPEGEPIRGSFRSWWATLTLEAEATLADAEIEVRVDARGLDTGDAGRDRALHGRLFLDASNYRTILFHGRQAIHARDARWRILGDLTIKESTGPVLVDVTWGGVLVDSSGRSRAGCSARCSLDPERFGLGPALGPSGGPARVDLTADLEFLAPEY